MQVEIFDFEFKCPDCGKVYLQTLEENCGVSCCPKCKHEFDWEINVNY